MEYKALALLVQLLYTKTAGVGNNSKYSLGSDKILKKLSKLHKSKNSPRG